MTKKMSTTPLHEPWVNANTFLGNGGTVRLLDASMRDEINDTLDQLTREEQENLDVSPAFFYDWIRSGLDFLLSEPEDYINPQCRLAISAEGKICGAIGFYEEHPEGHEPFMWIQGYIKMDGVVGAVDTVIFVTGQQYHRKGFSIQGNPTMGGQTMLDSMARRIPVAQDPNTKWYKFPVEDHTAFCRLQQENVMSELSNLSKLWIPFPVGDGPCHWDEESQTWVED